MDHWIKPDSYRLYPKLNEQVNFKLKKRFEAEQIKFAFPSRTIYIKKDLVV
jgi:small-conductance mechanosensitive channel